MLSKIGIKQIVVALLVFAGALFGASPIMRAHADETMVIEVLERSDCAHCQEEEKFLSELSARRDDFSVKLYDIDREGKELFDRITALEQLPKATPVTIVGGVIIQGFDASDTTGKRIESLLDASKGKEQVTFDQYLAMDSERRASKAEQVAGASCADGTVCAFPNAESYLVSLPFIRSAVDVSKFSLPMLSVVLGFVDGFNPCAMWVLVTFLVLLAQTGSRKKLIQVAGLFIVAETVMYYLILNVWFTTWNFIGLDRIVTPIVGIVATGGGLFFLYEWYKSLGTKIACQIVDAENRSKIVQKIKKFITGDFTVLAALGIIGLAFTVNVIEFACSIGIPQAFTKIIELNHLGFWQTQFLMAIFIFFYMIDDILVFGLAIWGFEKMHLTEKYSQWSALIGGVLMLLLGYLLMFRPDVVSRLG
ncbi:MAG: glutaredoxin [Candidatus Moraniibacteriota bacterium]|nr:MAG: glutaredoxin [Candidatus Moranbacteria bacterium]